MQALQSAHVDELTTAGLAAFRDLIIEARRERESAEYALRTAVNNAAQADRQVAGSRTDLAATKVRLARLEASFFRAFRRGTIAATKIAIDEQRERLTEAEAKHKGARDAKDEAEKRLDSLCVDTEFRLAPAAHGAWTKVSSAFEQLSRCTRIWDVTAFRSKSAGAERSVATQVVDRQLTRLSVNPLPVIESQYQPLQWHNANGGDLYLFPGFLIMFQGHESFAMLELGEVSCGFSGVKFHETEPPPADSQRVGTTWTYTNKSGKPDRRYADNPEIPVMLYGEIHWTSKTGLNEGFQFSNVQAAAGFVDALNDFARVSRTQAG